MTVTTKLLFVCSQNKWRSLTAEKIFENVDGYQVRSAGTEPRARVRITSGHIGWADWIFVMEKKHLRVLQAKFAQKLCGKQIACLHINDDYGLMDRELIEVLKASLSEYIVVPD